MLMRPPATSSGIRSGWIINTGKRFFFEKKEAKNFCFRVLVATPVPVPAFSKSFLLLFFKKEALGVIAR